MNWLDIVLLGIFALSLAAGLMKGLVREVFALAGVILGVIVALLFGDNLGVSLERWIPLPSAAYAAAVVGLFVGVMVLVSMLSGLLDKVVSVIQLGWANRLLGGVFGILRAFVISVILVMALALYLEPDHEVFTESKITPYLLEATEIIAPLLPEEFRVTLREHMI